MYGNMGNEPSINMRENAVALGKIYGDKYPQVNMSKIDAELGQNSYNVEVLDGRKDLISKAYKEFEGA